MYSTFVLIATAVAVLACAAHYLIRGPKSREPARQPRTVRRASVFERVVHAGASLSFLVLAGSGFGSALVRGELSGWALWLHMLAAPVFAVSLTALAVRWAERARFAGHDWRWIRRGGGYFGGEPEGPAGRFDGGQKLFFWATLLLGFTALGSIMLSMTEWFGQAAQETLYALHRYSALLLLAAVIVHGYITLLAKPGTWRAMLSGRVSSAWARRHHGLWWQRIKKEGEQSDDA